jgi:hypothetical protein
MSNKTKLTVIMLILVAVLGLCMGAYTETRRNVWRPCRTTVTADDTALDGTTAGYTFQFADKPAEAISLNPEDNEGEIYFYGTDAADEDITGYKVYTWKENGPARLWCNGAVTLGAALKSAGVFYADTITVTDGTADCNSFDNGNDRVATLYLNSLKGCRWLYVEFDVNTVASISCEFTSW